MLAARVPHGDGKLSKRQRLELLAGELPELLGLSKEMNSITQVTFNDLIALSSFLTDIMYGSIPRERIFLEYIEAKLILLHSYCTNVLFAMFLRAEGRNIRTHPVMKQLLEHQYTMRDLKRLDSFWQKETNLLLKVHKRFCETDKGGVSAENFLAEIRRERSTNYNNDMLRDFIWQEESKKGNDESKSDTEEEERERKVKKRLMRRNRVQRVLKKEVREAARENSARKRRCLITLVLLTGQSRAEGNTSAMHLLQ